MTTTTAAPATYTAKRNTVSTCPICGEVFRQDGIGRMRKFCSDACKQKAHRRAAQPAPAAPRRREICEVRTEYIEQSIALAEARRDYGAVDTMRSLARHIGAPIDAAQINHWRRIFAAEIARSAPAPR